MLNTEVEYEVPADQMQHDVADNETPCFITLIITLWREQSLKMSIIINIPVERSETTRWNLHVSNMYTKVNRTPGFIDDIYTPVHITLKQQI